LCAIEAVTQPSNHTTRQSRLFGSSHTQVKAAAHQCQLNNVRQALPESMHSSAVP